MNVKLKITFLMLIPIFSMCFMLAGTCYLYKKNNNVKTKRHRRRDCGM